MSSTASIIGGAHRRNQSGITLIVAMVFLAVLALLGVTAAQNGVLEERMAGNTRDRDLAFQAAEASLQDAKQNIATLRTQLGTAGIIDASSCAVPTTPPCYLSHGNDAAYWTNTFVWNTTNARNPPNINQVAAQPLYLLERIAVGPGTLETYRVTARGVGTTANSVAITQEVFTHTP